MKHLTLVLLISFALIQSVKGQDEPKPFITTWNVPGEGSFTIPLSTNQTYNFEFHVIEESDTLSSGTHTNADGDFNFFSFQSITVELHIYGQFPHFANYTKDLLLDVNQWGDIVWQSMAESFKDWTGVGFSATDTPDLSNVTSMNRMFQAANAFNTDISSWDVSNIKNFGVLFFQAHAFNRDISSWNVSSATNMISMFRDTRAFNQDLSSWDVDSVGNMVEMFMDARAFNEDISAWDIRSVNNFSKFLEGASSFSDRNYDKLLTAWADLADSIGVAENIRFDARGKIFCLGEEGRNSLIDNFGWQFNDAGNQCSSANDIVSFTPFPFLSLVSNTIDVDKHLVQIYLGAGKDLTNITPLIEFSANAAILPASGTSVDLSLPVTYTVTAFDGTEQEWTVEVLDQPFITTWQVITVGETITIPTNTEDHFNYRWLKEGEEIESGFHLDFVDGDFVTTFDEAGNYQLEILGYFAHFADYPKDKLLDVVQWGDIIWRNMESSFEDWPGAGFSATDAPDLTNVTNMRNMYFRALNFNSPLNHWDVSNIIFMRNLFSGASSFNQDLDNWNVSQVTDFESVFRNALAFNGNIKDWQVNEATTMFLMFSGAENFNQDITNWQTLKARDMTAMFAFTKKFNQNISQWNVSSVENTGGMFFTASSFNQDLSSWNIGSITNMADMFNFSGLSPQNYDKILLAWATQEVRNNVSLGALGITFCTGSEARQTLIDDHNWTINDDGLLCSSETDFLTFSIAGQIGETTINAENHTVSLVMPFATDFTALTPNFTLSPGASTNPESGKTQNFSSSVVYIVTAEDSTTTEDWVITVNRAQNIATDIETVTSDAEVKEIFINTENHSVDLLFVIGTDISAIQLFFTYSEGATSSVGEEGLFDFTNLLAVTVTAEDDSTKQEWVISAEVAPNNSTDFLTFSLEEQIEAAVIDKENHTVLINVALGTELSDLIPEFTLSEGARSNPTTGEAVDFSDPVTYIITAEDDITIQEWLLTVNVEDETVLGIGKQQKESIGLHYYPNPTQNLLNINAKSEVQVYLIDLNGQQVISPTAGVKLELDLTSLNEGVYLLVVKSKGLIFTEKIIKN